MDNFQSQSTMLDSPARDAFAVVPDNDEDLEQVTRALYIATLGNVAVVMYSGAEVTFTGVIGLLPVCVRRVKSTGTTSTGIIGLV